MKLKGSLRLIVVVIYSLLAAVVGWANRDALYYLDAWVTFVAVAAVPALLITGHALWARAYPDAAARWQKRLGIGFSICMFLAFGWLGINAMFISLDAGATPISDVHKYDFIISRWQDPFTAQFPRPIPADARDVRFHYDPGFLQAATILEISPYTI